MVLMLLQELQIILESGSLLKHNTLESLYTQAKKQKHLNLVTIIQSNIPIYQLLQHIKHLEE